MINIWIFAITSENDLNLVDNIRKTDRVLNYIETAIVVNSS